MGNAYIAATGKAGVLPGNTPLPPLGPQSQQHVAQQDGDHISRTPKTKPHIIPQGNAPPSANKKNETPEKTRFSRVVVDGLSSGKFWLGVLGSSAIMLLLFFIDDSIKKSSTNSSNMPMKN